MKTCLQNGADDRYMKNNHDPASINALVDVLLPKNGGRQVISLSTNDTDISIQM